MKPKIHFERVYTTISGIKPPQADVTHPVSNQAAGVNDDDPADTGTPPPVWEANQGNVAGTGHGSSLGESRPAP